MDIVTIEQKLSDSKYSCLKEFVDDFTLIFDNCYEYNGADSGELCLSVCVYVSVCLSICACMLSVQYVWCVSVPVCARACARACV